MQPDEKAKKMREKTDEVRRMFNLPESEVVVQGVYLAFRRVIGFSCTIFKLFSRLSLQNLVFFPICSWAHVGYT